VTIAPQIGQQAAFYYGRARDLLIATTALVATAGVAAADVTLNGWAALGVVQGKGIYGDSTARIENNVEMFIVGTTETDSGVSLKATVLLENNDGANYTGSVTPDASTLVEVGFGGLNLAFGNTDGAADRVTGETPRLYPGIRFEGWGGHIDNTDANPVFRAEYTFGDILVAASYAGADEQLGLGARYTISGLTVGLAYENAKKGKIAAASAQTQDLWNVSAAYTMNDLTVSAIHWRSDNDAGVENRNQTDIGVQYKMGAITVAAEYLMNDTAGTDNYTVWGSYDLGGGAYVFGQVGTRDYAAVAAAGSSPARAAVNEEGFASAGIRFAF
jgi:outer membrane protein OmpU